MSMSTSDTQVLGSLYDLHQYLAKCAKLVIKSHVDKLGQFNHFDDYFFEHFGKCYNLVGKHHFFQLGQFDNVLYVLQHLGEHFNFVIPHDFLTFILIFCRLIINNPCIYDQLDEQLAFQLKLLKKLHIIAHEQFDDKSKPYLDI
ncbi:hypothetical protein KC316_g9671 [Hortaea werneckii]|nr:hypothetical protein KC324_g12680 [Hortaea werneckii]KAI7578896.1 hypothetical protein KC316_g9671 [Hortaea werneckii]